MPRTFERKEQHNFKPVAPHLIGKKPEIGKQFWWCKKCDTIIKFPAMYNGSDINKSVSQSKLLCLPPMIGELAPKN